MSHHSKKVQEHKTLGKHLDSNHHYDGPPGFHQSPLLQRVEHVDRYIPGEGVLHGDCILSQCSKPIQSAFENSYRVGTYFDIHRLSWGNNPRLSITNNLRAVVNHGRITLSYKFFA